MAWIELHQTLPTNKKTLRLKNILKIKTPQVIGHLCMLWLWALDNAQDGNLSEFDFDELAEVSGWTGRNADIFIEALKKAGFINDDMTLHDWDEYAGRLMDKRDIKREQARERQQRRRDKLKTSREDNADVTRDNSVSNAPIPYPTVPYPTVPNPTPERKDTKENPPVLPDDGDDVYSLYNQTGIPGNSKPPEQETPNPSNPFGLSDAKMRQMIGGYRERGWSLNEKMTAWEEAHKDSE